MDRTGAFYRELAGVIGHLGGPSAIPGLYHAEDALLESRATAWMVSALKQHRGVAALMDSRWVRGCAVDVDELRELPTGSLGREVARFIEENGLVADYYEKAEVHDEATWAAARMRETHDVWHTITGFAPTFVGEVGLKSFELAQVQRPVAGVVIATALMRYAVGNPQQLRMVLRAAHEGFELGQAAAPLLGERWEDHWSEPLADLRSRLRIVLPSPVASGRLDPTGVRPHHQTTPMRVPAAST